jgi:hypothetical protein
LLSTATSADQSKCAGVLVYSAVALFEVNDVLGLVE